MAGSVVGARLSLQFAVCGSASASLRRYNPHAIGAGGSCPSRPGFYSCCNFLLPAGFFHQCRSSMTDPDEFEAFVRAHQDMVFATAVRLLGREAEAQDVAQTVFLKAFERFET